MESRAQSNREREKQLAIVINASLNMKSFRMDSSWRNERQIWSEWAEKKSSSAE